MTIYCDKCGASHDSSVCPSCIGFGKSRPMTAPDDVRARLLPCPFCGKAPQSRWFGACAPDEDCGYWGIDCCIVHAHEDNEADAVAKWNRRAAHADLSGEVRELVEAASGFREAECALSGTRESLERKWAAGERLDTSLAKFARQRAINYVSGSVDVHGQFHPTHQEKP